MPKVLKVGIVGCGAIGSSLARAVARDFKQQAKLVALFDLQPEKSRKLSRRLSGGDGLVVRDIRRLIQRSELVIEAASAASSLSIAKEALSRGRDIMLMSIGGVINAFTRLNLLAAKNNCRIFLPSGAIAGIDALKAAKAAGIKSVVLTTRKNPAAFKNVRYVEAKGIKLDKIKGEKVLFYGSARQAVKNFPQNINVAAILSIAGIGQERTRVRIIASPEVKENVHEIEVVSRAGKVFTRTQNILHPDNPKTSYLAVLSAIATLKQIFTSVKIGT